MIPLGFFDGWSGRLDGSERSDIEAKKCGETAPDFGHEGGGRAHNDKHPLRALNGANLIDQHGTPRLQPSGQLHVERPPPFARADRADNRATGSLMVTTRGKYQSRPASRLLRSFHRIEFDPRDITDVGQHPPA